MQLTKAKKDLILSLLSKAYRRLATYTDSFWGSSYQNLFTEEQIKELGRLTTTEQRDKARSYLLEASKIVSRNICNDHDLPNTQEMVDMLNDMEQLNVGSGRAPEHVHVFDPEKEKIMFYDWWLMEHLASLLQDS